MNQGITIAIFMGLLALMAINEVYAQNSSQINGALGSIEELEKLTGNKALENFSFIQSIGNATESIVNATANAIANITSNDTDTKEN